MIAERVRETARALRAGRAAGPAAGGAVGRGAPARGAGAGAGGAAARCCCSTSRSRTWTRSCGCRRAAEIRRVQEETGVTTLHVTHDQGEALALGHRVAVLRDGRLEQVGNAGRGLGAARRRGGSRGFVGTPPMNILADGRGGFRAEDAVVPRRPGGEYVFELAERMGAERLWHLRRARCRGRARAEGVAAPERGTPSRYGRRRRACRGRDDAGTGRRGGAMMRSARRARQLALMLAPYALGALLLFVVPAAYSLALALTDADLLTPSRFVGLGELRGAGSTTTIFGRRAVAVGAVRGDRGAAAPGGGDRARAAAARAGAGRAAGPDVRVPAERRARTRRGR